MGFRASAAIRRPCTTLILHSCTANKVLASHLVKLMLAVMAGSEGCRHLRQEPGRITAIEHTNIFNVFARRQVPRPEHQIPQNRRIAKVAIGCFGIARVVPTMRLRAPNDIVQRAVAESEVAVLKEAVDGVEQKIARDHLRRHAKEEKRHGVEAKMKRLLKWMEAPDVERVEDFWGMVHLMQARQLRVMMTGAMQPVQQ